MRIVLIVLAVVLSKVGCAQTFNEYKDRLGELSYPNKFDQWPDSLQEYTLPADLFNHPIFDLSSDRAFARVELDINYSIILIGTLSDEGDYFTHILGVSFDSLGNCVDKIPLSHDAVGEGSTFSLTPEGKIRVADYGASDAIIWTYRYENGRFIREGEPEYGDVDDLPDY